jgi:Protein of unknown function (DUF2911)
MSFASTIVALTLAATGPVNPDTACVVQNPDRMPAKGRPSPLDSVTVQVGPHAVKVCYGRPSLRGRQMLGSAAIPYGKLWRTGANEPTIFYTPVALRVAGIKVGPGVYSLYTVPGEKEWEVIVNRSISQWGHENRYTAEVKAQEVGRGKVAAESVAKPVETFTIRGEQGGGGAGDSALVLEWENTRVKIPVRAG